ncbi:CDP-alcohol phosphatidyltransferase family protein [Polycladidibacter hongkongensis]|uniref:CDP-alcohol phosphatidyltransferase family protein n=1 Tax=Polycladidibacter hongkongensis TaxID=1647556 RepID=UPI0008328912|nr:CDP-alcohol phosphatidyltransferase family protein [Pseudovibrio hongkongensis]
MIDSQMRRLIDPPLNRAGQKLAATGLSANAMSAFGLLFGLAAAIAIYAGAFSLAFLLVVLNRLADGLDGAIARATRKTDLGGFLDIIFDFCFYGAVPLAFALHAPGHNALAASVLLASFYLNGSAFLAFALFAQKHGLETAAQGQKSFYYLAGLAEGTETILVFLCFCLWPQHFSLIALAFAMLCLLSSLARIMQVAHLLHSRGA